DAVERFVGRPFDTLAFVGGGANSALWAQIHADATGRPVRPVRDPVLANVRGAALLTLLALGRIEVGAIPAMVATGPTYEPDPATRPLYDMLYREFVDLYKQTRRIHRRLNRH
ncbi:MAG TPA: FGGY-family carbohydrate kinase, partial [Acidimicrobiales bacterium]|nr:FGGY-family carbohydrate kinase [Acidimicrobiales bacterium]